MTNPGSYRGTICFPFWLTSLSTSSELMSTWCTPMGAKMADTADVSSGVVSVMTAGDDKQMLLFFFLSVASWHKQGKGPNETLGWHWNINIYKQYCLTK